MSGRDQNTELRTSNIEPLEHYRWWWQVNRWLGSMLPSLCIEVQVVAAKTSG